MPHYVVLIWDHAPPADWTQVQSLSDRLNLPGTPSSPKFAALSQALAAQAPEDDEDWVEGLDPPVDGAVWAMAVNPRRLGRALNRLIETATGLGLSVYDRENQRLDVLGGQTITPQGRARRVSYVEEQDGREKRASWLKKSHVLRLLERRLLPAFASRGFALECEKGPYCLPKLVRDTALGRQTIEFCFSGGDRWTLDLNCDMSVTLPSPLREAFGGYDRCNFEIVPDGELSSYREDPRHRTLVARSPEALEALIDDCTAWLSRHALPMLDACSDAEGFVRCDAGEPGRSIVLDPSAVTVAIARLSGVEDIEPIVERLLRRARERGLTGAIDTIRTAAERLRDWPPRPA